MIPLKLLKEYVQRGGPVVKEGKTLIFSVNRHLTWQIVKEWAEKAGLPRLVNPETGRVHTQADCSWNWLCNDWPYILSQTVPFFADDLQICAI